MTLEELVYSRLSMDDGLSGILAEYSGKPAIFLQKAPDDTAAGWERSAPKYPRCEYLVDLSADPERHTNGMVTVHVYCASDGVPPEEIAPVIRNAITDVIFPAEGRTYAAVWASTELFEMTESKSPGTQVNGATLQFALTAFPDQDTVSPDPAGGMQDFLKIIAPEAFVIGMDHAALAFVPEKDKPAFYVRVSAYFTDSETYALRWVRCSMAVHVVAPEPEWRAGWARYVADMLNAAGKVILRDGSPMLVRGISVENGADYLARGQVIADMLYSVPVYRHYAHPLNNAKMNEKEGA